MTSLCHEVKTLKKSLAYRTCAIWIGQIDYYGQYLLEELGLEVPNGVLCLVAEWQLLV